MLACPLNSTIETRYLEPLSKNNSADLVRFSAHTTQAKDMRGYMNRAYALYTQKPFGFEIRLRNAVSELWLLLLENMPETTKVSVSHDLERVRSMVHYIESFYPDFLPLLIASVKRTPTMHTVWMLNRCINGKFSREELLSALREVAENENTDKAIRDSAKSFLDYQTEK